MVSLATIPLTFLSPTATTVEYFIEATDNDDMFGNCDHRVVLPATGVFEVPITRYLSLPPSQSVNGARATRSV